MAHSSKEKSKALMQYICQKIPAEYSGRIKLNKICWFSEIETMYKTGHPLTGNTYIRQCFGPVVLNAHLMREELVREGKIQEITNDESGRKIYRYKALQEVEIEKIFSGEEISIIDGQIRKYLYIDAHGISDLSHDSIWASLEDSDEMTLDLLQFQPVDSGGVVLLDALEQHVCIATFEQVPHCDAFDMLDQQRVAVAALGGEDRPDVVLCREIAGGLRHRRGDGVPDGDVVRVALHDLGHLILVDRCL